MGGSTDSTVLRSRFDSIQEEGGVGQWVEGTTEGREVALDGILENRVDRIQGGCVVVLELGRSADERPEILYCRHGTLAPAHEDRHVLESTGKEDLKRLIY